MSQLANAYDTTQAAGANREDIHDIINFIDPTEVPVYSLFNRNSRNIEAVKHEWTMEELGAPNEDNAKVQGYQYTFDASDTPAKVGNYTQIFDKTYLITETQEAVKKVGRKSDVNRMKMKRGKEMKRDIDLALIKNQASVAPSGAVAGRFGGLPAWLATNDSMGGGGSSGGWNSGTSVVDARTNGAQRALTKLLVDDGMQNASVAGGKPRIIMGSPYVKRVFSTFMSDANVAALRTQTSGRQSATLIGAVDAYVSDFGLIDFVPHVQMPDYGAAYARNVYLIDESMARIGWLRKIHEDKDVPKNGDAIPGVLKAECTLIVDNEKAHALIADVYGLNAAA